MKLGGLELHTSKMHFFIVVVVIPGVFFVFLVFIKEEKNSLGGYENGLKLLLL